MGANFSRIKTWVSTEDVTYSDLNAEFDNILTNLVPTGVDDYSANVSQMQTTVDPGEVGTESLATTLAGEIARLRFMINEITGEDEWYESPLASLAGLSNAVGTGLTDNRIVSGRTLTTSSQLAFLVPNGAARTVKVDGTPTSFIYYVDGVEYQIITDTTLTNLTAAPSSNNTCLINDAVAADQYWTKYAGEDGSEIPVDNMGTEISSLVGKLAGFKLNNGSSDEYFIAYVDSTTRLTKARRGYFFDSSDTPIPRITYANNDTITLMKLTWIFAKSDLTLTATYNNPVWSDDEPSSPAIGDYWFDISANTWKVYGVGSYSVANAILIGVCLQDATNCIAARSFDPFKSFSATNTFELFSDTNSIVRSRYIGSIINVWGETIKNDYGFTSWDMALDLESGVTEAASTYYYFYITATGDKVISDKKPHDRREDLLGYYHPLQSWRCVGWAFNNASSNLEQVESYYKADGQGEVIRSVAATDYIISRDRTILLSGASFTEYLPPAALNRRAVYTFIHNGTSLTQVYTIDGYASETIGGATTVKLHTNGQVLKLICDGSGWLILESKTNTDWTDAGAITITATTSNPTKATTREIDRVLWRRNGGSAHVRIEYVAAAAAGSAAGSGDYKFAMPSNIVIDTTKVRVYATVGAPYSFIGTVGNCYVSDGTSMFHGSVSVFDSGTVRAAATNATTTAVVSSSFVNTTAANTGYGLNFIVPVTDWLA